MIKKRSFPKIFFGWWMLLATGFLTVWGQGMYAYGLSVFFKPLASELGFSRAVTSVAGGIGRFEGGFEAPLSGWLTDRFGPKRVILFGISLFSIGLILMNFINSLWAFYVVWGIITGTGVNIGLSVPVDKAITNWFVKKRGTAMGIRWLFTGTFIIALVTWLVTTQGWRIACALWGLITLCVGVPLVWFMIREERPEYYGLLPDGARAEAESKEDISRMIDRGIKYAAEVEEVEFTLKQAMRTPAYWLVIASQAGYSIAQGSLLMHFVPFLTDMGMSPAKASAIITVAGTSTVVARFGIGFLADRIKKESLRFLFGGAILLEAFGIIIFLLRQTMTMVYPFLLVFYTGFGATLVMMSLLGGRYFGRKAFGSIRGSMTMFAMPAAILGPTYTGWVYDTTGNYIGALTTFAATTTLAAVIMFLTRPPKLPAKVTDIRSIV